MAQAPFEHRVRLGVLGHGTVGKAFVDLVQMQSDAIAARSGVKLEVARVAVRDASRHRDDSIAECLTEDPDFVVGDPTVDLVVEVMGGIEPARTLILKALRNGKPVVTANKALIANHGAELFEAADKAGIDLLFCARVCVASRSIESLASSTERRTTSSPR